ncbi:uncharacterized protein Bfra_001852 [Botrytis fragariae]|uniref:Uncharacterized protein n=1 Tax=Botrytis fragariae TaxID=1964551 RepID=A0A8H6EMM8_9HELO|nr:uncharacterized protein Bfra_001852 [Botrytis fragariae]KAF5877485.1 hypothetical protein Bfra_001852 [Botrytis fragariae]
MKEVPLLIVNVAILGTDMFMEKASIWTAGSSTLLGSSQRRHEVKAPTFNWNLKSFGQCRWTNNYFLVSLMT